MGNSDSSNKTEHNFEAGDIIGWDVMEVYFSLNLKYEIDLTETKNYALNNNVIPFGEKQTKKLINNSELHRVTIINNYDFNVNKEYHMISDSRLAMIRQKLTGIIGEINEEIQKPSFLDHELKLFNLGNFITIPVEFKISGDKYVGVCGFLKDGDFCVQGLFTYPIFKSEVKTYSSMMSNNIKKIIKNLFNDIILHESSKHIFININNKNFDVVSDIIKHEKLPVTETIILKQKDNNLMISKIQNDSDVKKIKKNHFSYFQEIARTFTDVEEETCSIKVTE